MIRSIIFIFASFLFCNSLLPDDTSRKIFFHTIKTPEEFAKVSAKPDSSTIAHTEIVKFMIDRKDKRKLWFFDTEKYSFHYAFALEYLSTYADPIPDHTLFNQREYSSPKRRFEMGSLIHFIDQDLWVVQLIPGDTLKAEEIAKLFTEVKTAFGVTSNLHFLPTSEEQETDLKTLPIKLPLTSSEEVYKGILFQPIISGHAIGYLRIVKGKLDIATVKPNQILVLEKLPEEIPVSAAVISQELQAPLAHIALLCGSRGTPNMSLRGALTDKNILSMDGQLVDLTIQPQQYVITPATLENANIFWEKLRPKKPLVPVVNLKEKRLLWVKDLRLKDAVFAGAKASQLGEVTLVSNKIITPGGFVIPIAYYFDQLAKDNIPSLIKTVLDATGNRSLSLEALRTAIEAAPIDDTLISEVKKQMEKTKNTGRWILRSSTNAEDLEGFNGAGLYRSIKIAANANDTEIANTLRKVWSSVWLQTAVEERNWYGVDHQAVGMAVLVQPYVEDAIANGVAITANPFAEFRPGLLINAQAKGGSVTGATGEEIPEQYLVYTFGAKLEFELLSKSSRVADSKIIMNNESLTKLSNDLLLVHSHFLNRWSSNANAVDVEFLVMTDNRIVILQARPYKVTYTQEQSFLAK